MPAFVEVPAPYRPLRWWLWICAHAATSLGHCVGLHCNCPTNISRCQWDMFCTKLLRFVERQAFENVKKLEFANTEPRYSADSSVDACVQASS